MKMKTLFVSTLAAAAFLGATGCSSHQPEPVMHEIQPLAVLAEVEPQAVSFPRPLKVSKPYGRPASLEERIRAGLYLFDTGDFTGAAEDFSAARDQLTDEQHELRVELTKSIAVSCLMAGERGRFAEEMARLDNGLSRYDRADLTGSDQAAAALREIRTNSNR